MKRPQSAPSWTFLLSLLMATCGATAEEAPLRQGETITLSAKRWTLIKLDSLPYVESDYTKRFKFDSFDNPKLKALRQQYHLDEVVAPGKDEFGRQVLLLDWVNHRFKKFGRPSCEAKGALEVLQAIDAGNTFFCAQYGDVLVSASASMGWIDRELALRRPNNVWHGSTEHTSTEIWSNQFSKWVLFDPTFSMYVEKDGVPLNAYEFREEWFVRDARDVTFVMDKDRKRVHKSDMPVSRARFAGFGDLSFDPGATAVYAFIGYIPNTDLMNSGPEYGKMFITRDSICDGTPWHERKNPADPVHDPYFPINQASLQLRPTGDHLHVTIRTMTPNFKTMRVRLDNGDWKSSPDSFDWTLREGTNRLEARSVNQFGVEGPVSIAEVRSENTTR